MAFAASPTQPDAPRSREYVLTELAISEGRHSTQSLFVCQGCRQWVPALVYSVVGGGGGIAGNKHLCEACAPKGVVQEQAALYIPAESQRKPQPLTLEERLMFWGARTGNPTFHATEDPRNNYGACLGRLFRDRAAADREWLDFSLLNHEQDVRKVAPLIKMVNGFIFDKAFIDARCELLGTKLLIDDARPAARMPAPVIVAPPVKPARKAKAAAIVGATLF